MAGRGGEAERRARAVVVRTGGGQRVVYVGWRAVGQVRGERLTSTVDRNDVP